MSFVLRLTSMSAVGREIVRTREVEGDRLAIGRDPDSDIRLSDLEVTRHHAKIRQLGPRRVAVRALAAIPLTVDGRSVEQAEIDAAKGGEVRIGSTRIAIAAGDEPGLIAVNVSRVEPAAEGAADASKRFSLAGVAPGKRPLAWLFAVVIVAIFLIWPIWSFSRAPAKLTPQQMAGSYTHIDKSWSAGPLSRAHAALAHDCKACHVGAFVAVPDSACKSCHADTADHADPHRLAVARGAPEGIAGLKQRIAEAFGRDPGRCVDCHIEHQGPGPMPAVPQGFCADCHGDLKAALPDTKLGDASDFGREHPQFTPVVMTTPGDHPRFSRITLGDAPLVQDSGLKFPHALHMSRTGGVAQMQATLGRKPMACADCHVPDESGARFRPVSMERDCQQCHSLAFDRVGGTVRTLRHGDAAQVIADIRDFYSAHPGGNAFVPTMRRRPGEIRATPRPASGAAAAIRAVFSPGGACYDCHVVVQPSTPGGLDYRVVPVHQQLRFMDDGWFDHSAHASTPC
ncbi:MAG TPA: cytochrome c3 family protein, partial [Sphingomonas sp.]|nr:cytochrome c3 family protein [Sphingomonas sp.]